MQPVWFDPDWVTGEPSEVRTSHDDNHFGIFVPRSPTDAARSEPVWNHLPLGEIQNIHYRDINVNDLPEAWRLPAPLVASSIHVIYTDRPNDENVNNGHLQLLQYE